MTEETKVSLVKTEDRNQGVRRAVALLKINPAKGKSVVLKPNFNSADPFPASTHVDTLRALINLLKEMGAVKVTLAERSGPGDTTRTVMEKKGVFALAKEIGFDIVNLQEMAPEGWVRIPPTEHWKEGFLFARIYREADSIVQTCCLKTHMYGGHFTLSLKNTIGMVPRAGLMSQLHSSPFQRQMIAELNTAYSPDLIVLDGIEAFLDGGPYTGKRVQSKVMLAGTDRIAIDVVGVAILRLFGTTPEVSKGKIFEQAQIARAVELGLGVKSPDQIQLVTDDAESKTFAEQVKTILLKG